MIRKLYSFAKRFTPAPQLEPAAVQHSAGEVSIPPSHTAVTPETSLLLRFHFLPTTIRDKWPPLAGNIDEIPEFRALHRKLMVMCSSRTGSEYLSYLLKDFGFDIYERFNIEPYVDRGVVPAGFSTIHDYIISLLRTRLQIA